MKWKSLTINKFHYQRISQINYEDYNSAEFAQSEASPTSAYSPSSPRAISPAVVAPITPPLTPPQEDEEAQPCYKQMKAPEKKIRFKKVKKPNPK